MKTLLGLAVAVDNVYALETAYVVKSPVDIALNEDGGKRSIGAGVSRQLIDARR